MLVDDVVMPTTAGVSLRTLLVEAPLAPGTRIIDGDEAHHARVVLRLRPGDDIRLADGDGHAATATVTGVGREALEVEVAAVMPVADGPAALLTVACALPKGDRASDLIRGLTEIGVGGFRPLISDRGERMHANPDRCARVSAEALKQCQRGRRLEILPPATVAEILGSGEEIVVLDPRGGPVAPGAPRRATLLVGPEGGWSEAERAATAAHPHMRLARTILRIETAAIAAAAVWSASWEACPA